MKLEKYLCGMMIHLSLVKYESFLLLLLIFTKINSCIKKHSSSKVVIVDVWNFQFGSLSYEILVGDAQLLCQRVCMYVCVFEFQQLECTYRAMHMYLYVVCMYVGRAYISIHTVMNTQAYTHTQPRLHCQQQPEMKYLRTCTLIRLCTSHTHISNLYFFCVAFDFGTEEGGVYLRFFY